MRRLLLQSTAFVRAARRLVKKDPETAPILQAALASLAEDAFHAALRTHKLKAIWRVHGPVVPVTTCGLSSSSSSTKAPRPSCCKRSGRTMRFTNGVRAEGKKKSAMLK